MCGEFTHWIFIVEAAIVLYYLFSLPSSSLNNVLSNDKGKQKSYTHLVMEKLEGKGSCSQDSNQRYAVKCLSQLTLGSVGVELKFEPVVHF